MSTPLHHRDSRPAFSIRTTARAHTHTAGFSPAAYSRSRACRATRTMSKPCCDDDECASTGTASPAPPVTTSTTPEEGAAAVVPECDAPADAAADATTLTVSSDVAEHDAAAAAWKEQHGSAAEAGGGSITTTYGAVKVQGGPSLPEGAEIITLGGDDGPAAEDGSPTKFDPELEVRMCCTPENYITPLPFVQNFCPKFQQNPLSSFLFSPALQNV